MLWIQPWPRTEGLGWLQELKVLLFTSLLAAYRLICSIYKGLICADSWVGFQAFLWSIPAVSVTPGRPFDKGPLLIGFTPQPLNLTAWGWCHCFHSSAPHTPACTHTGEWNQAGSEAWGPSFRRLLYIGVVSHSKWHFISILSKPWSSQEKNDTEVKDV